MPKLSQIVYTDDQGKEVLRQSGGRWDLVNIYGSVDAKEARRLHAALGELLTDLAEAPAQEEAATV